MRKILFVNRKGGCGKTTLVVNLAYQLSLKKKKVLVVDLDTQGHSSFYLTPLKSKDIDLSSYLTEGKPLSEIIINGIYKNIDVLTWQKNKDILALEIEFEDNFLKKGLEEVEGNYDYILFDLPPSMEKIVKVAFFVGKEVFVPLQTHFFALKGIAQLINLIINHGESGHELVLRGVIPTLYNKRTKIYRQVREEIIDVLGKEMLLPGIPYDIKLAEAPGFREPIALYAPESRSHQSFKTLCKAIMEMDDG